MASRRFLLVAAISTGALITAEAYAQSGPSAQDQTAGDSSDIKEIVVTAQKRSERLVDVPISISVVSPDTLASTNSKNLNELSGAVPGIQFNGNGGGGRTYISLRGTTGSALNTGDEPVAIYMDDVYLARGVTIGAEDLLDVGAIEIVRGPQGTLQGRNATAGAILCIAPILPPTRRGTSLPPHRTPPSFEHRVPFLGRSATDSKDVWPRVM